MKKIILFISLCFAVKAHSQIFPVGHMSINFKDASRAGGYTISSGITMPGSGRTIGAEVYYPATVAGTNTPVAPGAQYPVVVFGHGFAMGFSSYDNIYNRIASLGYIVLLPRTEGGTIAPPPVHLDFGKDLAFLAAQGMALNTVSTPTILTTFNGNVIQKSAIGGHSMGGGIATLHAAKDARIKKLITWAGINECKTPWANWNPEQLEQWKKTGIAYYKNSRTNQQMPLYYQLYQDFIDNEKVLNIQTAIKSLTIPILICHGKLDTAVPVEKALDLHRWQPNSKLFTLDTDHVFGRTHPWLMNNLPEAMQAVVDESIRFLQ